MGKNTSVSLDDHFEDFILIKIEKGRYHSASEVIRAGLGLLEHEENKLDALKVALEVGEISGIAKNFNANGHLNSLHKNPLKS
ncbi:MAG TPA: type II toxin-antitoxin system ParD family antitoxin [Bacteroidales bacterium]|nr:type II toxin-antitoxin system ParD family antitoxin [Bacteroidales bacterium]